MASSFCESGMSAAYTASYIATTYAEYFSIFILYSSICFSGTTKASVYSPTSLTVIKYYCTTSANTDTSISPYAKTDASIVSSSFKLYYNSRIMNLLFNNSSTSIVLIFEFTTRWFFIVLSFI